MAFSASLAESCLFVSLYALYRLALIAYSLAVDTRWRLNILRVDSKKRKRDVDGQVSNPTGENNSGETS